jgi:fructokinase
MAAKRELLCIGNAMVDVFAEVPADFCEQFDISAPVQHIGADKTAAILAAVSAATDGGRNAVYCAGGGAANTAKIAARLGVKAAFAGAVGTDCALGMTASASDVAAATTTPDRLGRLFEKELAQSGAELYLARKKSPTGVFISLTLPDGEKRIAAAPGAALELEPSELPETLFQNTRILMLEGFLLNQKALIEHCLKYAEQYSLTVALDPGTAEIAGEYAGEIVRRMKRFPLILFMNEAESVAFTGVLAGGEPCPNSALLQKLSEENSAVIVEKRAERGAVVYAGGKSFSRETIARPNAESTGAGDAFAAGFLQTYLRGEALEICADTGNKCAATVLDAPGTGFGHRDSSAMSHNKI